MEFTWMQESDGGTGRVSVYLQTEFMNFMKRYLDSIMLGIV
jgi:hypothetical protein